MAPYISWLAQHITDGRLSRSLAPCIVGQPVVVSGDLNHVPGSWPLDRLLARGLEDAVGRGGLFALTWPSGGGWLDFPVMRLDHVLHGPVGVRGLQKMRIPDSDHQGWLFSVGAD
jgi:endonuclease/exonuclease/phosphatase (EEP) superfamily protein YafD